MNELRVRIAPSPTGTIHVGLVRTALYNWLLARQQQGKFILRIEDTDPNRSTQESAEAIIAGFKWLGIDFDEGPYYQSQRFPIYQDHARRLVAQGNAYYCYCTAQELEHERQEAWAVRRIGRYDRRCLALPETEKARREAAGIPRVIRFLVPDGEVSFTDHIHGLIRRDAREIEDFILLRADGSPTYNFSVVVDDALMRMTHIIRGVEHITSTAKQILLYRALGYPVPEFAHLPVILGRDRKKLSKRLGAASVDDFRRAGYLPEALVNFLALLGWSPGGDREILTLPEMIREFSLDRVNKANAVFDEDKLAWMNSEYIRAADSQRLEQLVRPFLEELGIVAPPPELLTAAVALTRTRVRTLKELAAMIQPLVSDDYPIDTTAATQHLTPESKAKLHQLAERFEQTDFRAPELEQALRELAATIPVKAAALIHPCRVALTGRTVGPPLFDLIQVLGRERTLTRLRRV
ncbi:MAG: glutamate--tRNA ligase [candidate division WOR-3 bacterium]